MSSRERVYRTEALVLRRQDFGEADRLLTVYTPGHGRLRIIAKGVRRPRSRKAGHLELFNRVDLVLARGRDLDVITQAEATETYPGVRTDLIRLGYAAYVVELLDCFAVQEENRPLYRLLREALERLGEAGEPSIVARYFEMRLLDAVGYRPELFHCVRCGAEVRPAAQFFSPREGGAVCPNCGAGGPAARPISLAALKVLRHYQRSGFETVATTAVSERTRSEVEEHMQAYLTYVLERRLNTPAFLDRVRALQPPQAEPA